MTRLRALRSLLALPILWAGCALIAIALAVLVERTQPPEPR